MEKKPGETKTLTTEEKLEAHKAKKFASYFIRNFNIYHHANNLFKEDVDYLASLSGSVTKLIN